MNRNRICVLNGIILLSRAMVMAKKRFCGTTVTKYELLPSSLSQNQMRCFYLDFFMKEFPFCLVEYAAAVHRLFFLSLFSSFSPPVTASHIDYHLGKLLHLNNNRRWQLLSNEND